MTVPGWRRVVPGPVGCSVALLGFAMVVATLVLAPAVVGAEPGFELHPEFAVIDAALALAHLCFGVLVLAQTQHPIGWAMLAIGCGFATSGLAIQLALLVPADTRVWPWLVQLVVTGWVVGALTMVAVLPWLIDHAGLVGAARYGAAAGSVLVLLGGISRMLQQVAGGPPNPVAGGRWAHLSEPLTIVVLVGTVLVAGLGLWRLGRRLAARSSDRRTRSWIVLAVGLVAVSYVCFEVGLQLDGRWLTVATCLFFAAQIMLLTVVFLLVTGEPDWRFDLVVSRATVGALLGAAVVACYVAFVWLSAVWLPGLRGAGVVAVALLALAVTPLKGLIQRQVDALVFGPGAEAGRLLDRLGAEIEKESSAESTVLAGLLDGLRGALRLRSVSVVDVAGDIDVEVGCRPPHALAEVVPLRRAGRRVGDLLVTARAGRLDPESRRLLQRISGLLAVTLDLARVNGELERARTRLVEVRQEERRLLRRELHDGLGPTLSGAALALAAVERSGLAESDRLLLASLRAELEARCEDVRELARYALPPVLDDGLLSEALALLAARFSRPGFRVEVDPGPADRLDPVRQSVIYHVAAEALTNASRHAGAASCTVSLVSVGGSVRLTVADDGSGLAESVAPGVGLRSMRERAEELGGRFEIRPRVVVGTSPYGETLGTELLVELP